MKIETISYLINWKNFKRGHSFFVPCIDTSAAKEEIAKACRRLKMEIVTKVVIEDGVKGLRVWRM